MKEKVLAIMVAIIFLSGIAYNTLKKDNTTLSETSNKEILTIVKKVFPDVSSVEGPKKYELSKMFNSEKEEISSYMITSPYSNNFIGYAGPVPMIIYFDKNNTIRNIDFLENNETPAFLEKIVADNFFKGWDGLSIEDAIKYAEEGKAGASMQDSVAGATMSSIALRDGINLRLKMVKRK